MRIIVCFLLVTVLFSCKKEETFKPTSEYLKIVGEWGNIDGTTTAILSINQNGKIILSRNEQRSKEVNTNYVSFDEMLLNYLGKTWDRLKCKSIYNSKSVSNISIFTIKDYDTILTNVGSMKGNEYGTNNLVHFVRL